MEFSNEITAENNLVKVVKFSVAFTNEENGSISFEPHSTKSQRIIATANNGLEEAVREYVGRAGHNTYKLYSGVPDIPDNLDFERVVIIDKTTPGGHNTGTPNA